MRKVRIVDLVNPSAFFIALYIFYLLLIIIIDSFSSNLLSYNIIKFDLVENVKFIALFYLFVFILSAYVLTPLILGYKPKNFIVRKIVTLDCNRVLLFFLIGFLFFFLIHLYYFYSIGFIPAIHLEAATIRVSAKSGYGGILLLANGACYAAVLLVASVLSNLSKIKRYFIYFLVVFCALIISLEGFRGPAASLVLLFILVRYSLSDTYMETKSITFNLFLLGVIFIIGLSLVDVLRHGTEAGISSLLQVFWTMTVNLYNLNQIYNFFQENQFYYGMTFINDIAVAIPGIDSKFLGVELVDRIGLEFKGEGMTVTAPGEGYVNFGIIGVFFHALILGFFAELIYKKLITSKGTVNMSLLVFFSFSFSKITVAGVMPTIVFTVLPTLIFLLPMIYLSKRKIK